MPKFSKILRTRRFTFLTITVIGLGVITGVVIGNARQTKLLPKTDQPGTDQIVMSMTPSIRVLGTKRSDVGEGATLKVTLQNISTKNIKAYVIASGKGWVTKNYWFEDTTFAPNAVDEQYLPLSAISFKGTDKEFSVSGVFFDDGTVDGEAKSTLRLIQLYSGVRDQAKRLQPCLSRLSSAVALQHESIISKCESDANSLPLKGGSPDYEEGARMTQQMFLTNLGEVKETMRSNRLLDAGIRKESIVRVYNNLAQPAQ